MPYRVIEVITGREIGADLALDVAYAMRDHFGDDALERGRDLTEERYGLRNG